MTAPVIPVGLDTVAAACGAELAGGSPAGVTITDVTHDSRQVGGGFLFCCIPGQTVDGHDYAEAAIEAGAAALLVGRRLNLDVPRIPDVPQLVVSDVREAMSTAARTVHGDPSSELVVIGVTGTNGKSSIVQILTDIFNHAGRRAEMVGTLTGTRTTPESTDLQRHLRQRRDAGVEVVAVEVSSHALTLGRVAGTRFAATIFTNLGRDHLDFHHTMEDYFAAKASLFDPSYTRLGVINSDDDHGRRLLDEAPIETIAYGLSDAEQVENVGATTRFRWRGQDVTLGLIGEHNLSNALAAATTATALGVGPDMATAGLGLTQPVRGRFELVDGGQRFIVAVDYAHTPDALEVALRAARQAAGGADVIVVFGCGGDRDVQKRPEMGQMAEKGADVVVITSDNPRTEDPDQIIADIVGGLQRPDDAIVEPDRRQAIEIGIGRAGPGDVVLIAGKGHETYQVVGDQILDFDDRGVALEILGAKGANTGEAEL